MLIYNQLLSCYLQKKNIILLFLGNHISRTITVNTDKHNITYYRRPDKSL